MKFGEFRKYVSVVDRVSICMKETLSYKNYIFIKNVPDIYDDYYVYGVGMITSEFEIEKDPIESMRGCSGTNRKCFLADCIEIMLSETPRKLSKDVEGKVEKSMDEWEAALMKMEDKTDGKGNAL